MCMWCAVVGTDRSFSEAFEIGHYKLLKYSDHALEVSFGRTDIYSIHEKLKARIRHYIYKH